MTGYLIAVGLLLMAVGHFLAADLSDLHGAHRPKNPHQD